MPRSALEKRKAIAREFLAAIRAKTFCERCGAQPVDFHRKEHEINENWRVSRLAALGYPPDRIQSEINLCNALCRSCHMQEDGRSEKLTQNKPIKKGMVLVEPKPCIICKTLAKPTRKGMCRSCYDGVRRGKIIPLKL